jgi:hypothetical protein
MGAQTSSEAKRNDAKRNRIMRQLILMGGVW